MSRQEELLCSLEGKTDDEIRSILNRRFKLNWDEPEKSCQPNETEKSSQPVETGKSCKPNKPCKLWYAKVFTYCDPHSLEDKLNFFLFLVNTFGYLWHICFTPEDTIFLGCICPCGEKQTILYYSITVDD
jgi:hypothetical protein